MLCEKCGKQNATTHYTQIINGEKRELHLCAECAGSHTHSMFGELPNLFGSMFFGEPRSLGNTKTCPRCGASFKEISANGQLGCAACYETFAAELQPSLARLHGKTAHTGKIPKSADGTLRLRSQLADAKAALAKAIEAQEFEKAAALRDQIKEWNERLGDQK